MPFVSCEKQISSFATALGTASAADKQTIINALSVNKDVAYVESSTYKVLNPEYRPVSAILPVGTPVKFNASGDTSKDASFGSWNSSKDTFTFSKTGNYYINFDASLQTMVENRAVGYTNNCGSYFKIGGKDWHASGANFEYFPDSMTFQGASCKGSITVSASAGQTLQLWGWAVRDSRSPNLMGIGAPSGWAWGIQITQV